MEKQVVAKMKKFFKSIRSSLIWKTIFSKDWPLKFVSLMIAVVIWYVVGREDMVDKIVTVPIEVINMPRDLIIANQFKKEIEVTVSGPRAAIEDMTSRSVTRQINLSNASPGTSVIENGKDSIAVPRGVTVLRIQPSSILLSLDKLVQKDFPVASVTKGEVASGYQLEPIKLEPDSISITGPQTILGQLDELRTKIIDLTNLTRSRQLQIPLDLSPEIVELIGETSVTASIHVAPKAVEKIFPGVEINPMINGFSRKLVPDSADVVLNVPVNLIKKGGDLRSLFTLTGTLLADNETVQLAVQPTKDSGYPLDVVNIFPPAVKIDREKSAVKQDVPEKVDNKAKTSATGKTGQEALAKPKPKK